MQSIHQEQLVSSTILPPKIHQTLMIRMRWTYNNLEHDGVHVDVDRETPNNPLRPEHVGVTTRFGKRTSNS